MEAYLFSQGLPNYLGNEIQSLELLSQICDTHLKKGGYSRHEMADALSMSVSSFISFFETGVDFQPDKIKSFSTF